MMKRVILAAAIATALAGCGSTNKGTEDYSFGQKVEKAGNYAEAIEYYRTALSKNPENQQFRAALNSAIRNYKNNALSGIKSELNQSVLSKAIIDNVDSKFAEIAKLNISDGDVVKAKNEFAKKREGFLTDISNFYSEAKRAAENKDWATAKEKLTIITRLYPGYQDTSRLMTELQTTGLKEYLVKAEEAFVAEDFASAITLLESASRLDPGNNIAKQLLQRARENNRPQYFLNKAKAAISGQDWVNADKYCRKANSLGSYVADCANIQKQALVNLELQANEKISTMVSNQFLYTALSEYKQSSIYVTQGQNSDRKKVLDDLSSAIVATGNDLQNGDYPGIAWYLFSRLYEINPEYDELASLVRETREKVNDLSKKSIAVFDFNNPSNNPDAGILVANNLIAYLFNNASKDINILERENLKSILEEMKLGQIGVVSENTAKEMGRVYGIDYAIMGSVMLFKVDSETSQSSKTVRYKVGEEIQDNIDYLNWKAQNPDAKRDELKNAPQAKILVPKYAENSYAVEHQKKVGFIQLSFRIVDVSTGENTRVETMEKRRVVEDIGNEGIEDAGVEFNPMEIATDTELLQQITQEAVEEMSVAALRPLQNLEKTYFDQGEEYLLRRGQPMLAAESFVKALFIERLKSSAESPIALQSRKYLEDILKNHRFEI